MMMMNVRDPGSPLRRHTQSKPIQSQPRWCHDFGNAKKVRVSGPMFNIATRVAAAWLVPTDAVHTNPAV